MNMNDLDYTINLREYYAYTQRLKRATSLSAAGLRRENQHIPISSSVAAAVVPVHDNFHISIRRLDDQIHRRKNMQNYLSPTLRTVKQPSKKSGEDDSTKVLKMDTSRANFNGKEVVTRQKKRPASAPTNDKKSKGGHAGTYLSNTATSLSKSMDGSVGNQSDKNLDTNSLSKEEILDRIEKLNRSQSLLMRSFQSEYKDDSFYYDNSFESFQNEKLMESFDKTIESSIPEDIHSNTIEKMKPARIFAPRHIGTILTSKLTQSRRMARAISAPMMNISPKISPQRCKANPFGSNKITTENTLNDPKSNESDLDLKINSHEKSKKTVIKSVENDSNGNDDKQLKGEKLSSPKTLASRHIGTILHSSLTKSKLFARAESAPIIKIATTPKHREPSHDFDFRHNSSPSKQMDKEKSHLNKSLSWKGLGAGNNPSASSSQNITKNQSFVPFQRVNELMGKKKEEAEWQREMEAKSSDHENKHISIIEKKPDDSHASKYARRHIGTMMTNKLTESKRLGRALSTPIKISPSEKPMTFKIDRDINAAMVVMSRNASPTSVGKMDSSPRPRSKNQSPLAFVMNFPPSDIENVKGYDYRIVFVDDAKSEDQNKPQNECSRDLSVDRVIIPSPSVNIENSHIETRELEASKALGSAFLEDTCDSSNLTLSNLHPDDLTVGRKEEMNEVLNGADEGSQEASSGNETRSSPNKIDELTDCVANDHATTRNDELHPTQGIEHAEAITETDM